MILIMCLKSLGMIHLPTSCEGKKLSEVNFFNAGKCRMVTVNLAPTQSFLNYQQMSGSFFLFSIRLYPHFFPLLWCLQLVLSRTTSIDGLHFPHKKPTVKVVQPILILFFFYFSPIPFLLFQYIVDILAVFFSIEIRKKNFVLGLYFSDLLLYKLSIVLRHFCLFCDLSSSNCI